MHLFDTLVKPILEYGCEVWMKDNKLGKFEVFERNFLKSILGIRKQTPNLAVYGEFGRTPISFKLKEKAIKYFLRLQNLPLDSIIKKAFYTSMHLHDLGFNTWFTRIEKIMKECNLEFLINLQNPPKLTPALKYTIKKALTNKYKSEWAEQMSQGGSKITTYALFKLNLAYESYINLHQSKYRTAIARFRTGSHNLEVERGRHARPIIPKENRTCRQCPNINNKIEDEIHHLIDCPAFSTLRKPLLDAIISIHPTFANKNLQEKFTTVLTCKSKDILVLLGKFLVSSDKARV